MSKLNPKKRKVSRGDGKGGGKAPKGQLGRSIEWVKGIDIIRRVVLTLMLILLVYVPLYYGYFWLLPKVIGPFFPQLDPRLMLLIQSTVFLPTVGASYFLVENFWEVGKAKWGLLLTSIIVNIFLIMSLYQAPYQLFNRDGTSGVMYNPIDFKPYWWLDPGKNPHDKRDGVKLIGITGKTERAIILQIQGNIFTISDIFSSWGSEEPKALTPEEQLQVSLARYTDMWGNPEKVELNGNDWNFVAHVRDGDRIDYLSLKPFLGKENEEIDEWRAAITKKYGYRFLNGTNDNIWFGKSKNNTTVYVWVKKRRG